MEQKADKGITRMEKEQKKLAHIMGVPPGDIQRRRRGGWK